MKWYEVSIHTTKEALDAVTNILHEAGAGGVVIEDRDDLYKERENNYGEIYELNPLDYPEEGVIVKAYYLENSYLKETIEEIQSALTALEKYNIAAGNKELILTEVNEEDWATAWKTYYKPTKITDNLVITPTWEEYEVENGEIVIRLDPGMAFGTGTHPTTALSLRALSEIIQGGEDVCDVGTGTGILAIAAAKLGAKRVLSLDLDEVAIKVAQENISINQVNDLVKLKKNNLLNGINEEFDIIIANILAEVIIELTPQVITRLKNNGYYIISGIIHFKVEEVIANLNVNGLEVIKELNEGDWVTLIVRKQKEN